MTLGYATRLVSFLPSREELETFVADPSVEPFLNSLNRTITWIKLLHEKRDQDETSVLLAAAHSKVIEIWILVPLGLLHSSYTALRTVVDICTSYTFYCSHPVEWQAVCEDRAGWESRASIVNWHVRFTPTCREVNNRFGFVDALNRDYEKLSSYVHGVPVTGLPKLKGIERSPVPDQDLRDFIQLAQETDANLNLLLLSVFHLDLPLMSNNDLRAVARGLDRRKLREAGVLLPRV